MRGSKHKRKRIKLQCLECNLVFDDDYRKRHKQTCHQGKRVRVSHKDASANSFVALCLWPQNAAKAKRNTVRSRKIVIKKTPQAQEENEEKGELCGMK